MIGVLFITWNFNEKFLETFKSIEPQVDKILIIDNGSKKPTLEILKNLQDKYSDKLLIKHFEKNTGHAYPYNIGLPILFKEGCDQVVLSDQDSTFSSNYVHEIQKAKEKYGDLIFGANIIDRNSGEAKKYEVYKTLYFYRTRKFKNGILFPSVLISSGTVISKSIFEKVGKYEEKFFNAAFDHEYCLRAGKKDIRCAVVEEAKMSHSLGKAKKVTPLLNSKQYSPDRLFYVGKAHCLIMKKYWTSFGLDIWIIMTIMHHFLVALFLEKQKFAKIKSLFRGCYVGLFKENI